MSHRTQIFNLASLVVACFILMASTSSAHEPRIRQDDEVEISFGWKKGDIRRYSVKRTEFQSGVARPTKNTTFRLEIVSSQPDHVVAKCNYLIELGPNPPSDVLSSPIARQLIEMYRNLDILVRIGSDGTFQGIQNPKEVEKAFQTTLNSVQDTVESIELDEQKMAFLNRFMKETTNLTKFQDELLTPLNLLLMVTATAHSKTKPYQQESTTELMFAKNVPTTETYHVDNFDPAQHLITVHYSQVAQGDKAEKLVKAAVQAFIKKVSPDSNETIVVHGVISDAKGQFHVNYETGWPTKISWKTKVNDLKTGILRPKQTILIEAIAPSPVNEKSK